MNDNFTPVYMHSDGKGNAVLNDEFLMSFAHHDGFSERLLDVTVLVDRNMNTQVFHKCFGLGNHPREDKSDFQFKQLIKETPEEIVKFVKQLSNQNAFSLKDHYYLKELFMEDMPDQHYLFNVGSRTKSVIIDGTFPLNEIHFASEFEKELLKIHLFIQEWTEGIYSDYIKSFKR